MIDEGRIRAEAIRRVHEYRLRIECDRLTPSGRLRSVPMYECHVENSYLRQSKVVKARSDREAREKAIAQLERWAEMEIRGRLGDATEDAKARADQAARDAQERIDGINGILAATLEVNDRIDWDAMLDKSTFPPYQAPPPFQFEEAPRRPGRGVLGWLVPPVWKKKLAKWDCETSTWRAAREAAEQKYRDDVEAQEREYKLRRAQFAQRQKKHNESVEQFRTTFEAGESAAIEEYIKAVFERSAYPQGFERDYQVSYDSSSKTAIVDVEMPRQSDVPNVVDVKFDTRGKQLRIVEMKSKEHDELYDSALKQTVLRTMHEVFESVYIPHVEAVVVNGWVTWLNDATGHDEHSCVISVSASRAAFEKLNLARIDPSACIKSLRGLIAGPMSQVAPVKPIMQLDRSDSRFVEAREVLAEMNATTNLAEIPWEDFEHLVRELFEKMFSAEGAEVRVTQASNDGGVDAVVFDPDPIRGGKFVIQAKRYTKVVPVAFVRDLYGTVVNEGASRGILVTTAHYGREAREFAKDKPITLIDGPNLVYLLEQHGQKVRIDIDAARSARATASVG